MFGSYLPTHEGRIYLALSALRMTPGATSDESAIDPETGLLNKDAFSDMAAEALKAGKEQGRDYNMTFLDLDGLDKVKAKLGEEEAEGFVAAVTAQLQASSVNGSSAGHLDGDKFGLVHDAEVNIEALEQSILESAKEADPDGAGVNVGTATVDLESAGLSEADDGKALLYTINKFSESRGDFTVTELNEGYKLMMKETKGKISYVQGDDSSGRV